MRDVLDERMRRALTSALDWHIMTSTEEGRQEAWDWSTSALKKVETDLSRRKSEYDQARASLAYTPQQRREISENYHEWRKRAIGFKGLLEDRRLQLKTGRRAMTVEYVKQREQAARKSLISLATAVAAHRAGEMSSEAVCALLDILTVPDGSDETCTLGELVERVAIGRAAMVGAS